ncbi:MAG TPA: hypothetical protein VNB06_17390, partial [Thermoanaerobaculia bacterium]|nr:hypothetical protein [Thermoanaerobaculia bacterium]
RGGIVPVLPDIRGADLPAVVADTESFPAGRTFLLGFEAPNRGLIARTPAHWSLARRVRRQVELLASRTATTVLLTIRTGEIYRMAGTLADFTVFSRDFVLRLAEDVEVGPGARPTA